MKSKNLKQQTKDIQMPNEKISKIISNIYCAKSMYEIENSDVNINHLENIFDNETYYLAMKIVPILERKVLYLSCIEHLRLNDICRRLKLQKRQVIALRNNAIIHFKNNLQTLYRVNNCKKGGGKYD